MMHGLGDGSMLLPMIQKQTLELTAPKTSTQESTDTASLILPASFNSASTPRKPDKCP